VQTEEAANIDRKLRLSCGLGHGFNDRFHVRYPLIFVQAWIGA